MDVKRLYLDAFEEILGLSLNLNNDCSISVLNLPKIISEINPISINNIISPIESLLREENQFNEPLGEKVLYKKILMTKYIYNLINPQAEIHNLDNFVEKLQALNNRTYEQHPCQMGFIVFKNSEDNIKDELSKLKIDYLPFDNFLNINEIDNNKQALRLIDSLSLCYVINDSYKVVGIAKKQKSSQSIASIMSNRHQKDDELKLKFYMYSYFIDNDPNNKFNLELEKVDYQIKDLDYKVNDLEISTKKARAHYADLQRNNLNSSDFHSAKANLTSLLRENIRLRKEKSSLMNTRLEILDNHINALETQKKGLKKFLPEKRIKTNQDIQFIQFNKNRIEWFINDSLICVLSNGKWRVQNYELISHIILEFILRQYIQHNDISSEKFIRVVDKIIPRSKILFKNIKELSNKNIGALLFIFKQSEMQKRTIYKKLLNKGILSDNNLKKVIKTDKSNPINLYSCDNYLFELICSVDGAVLLDRYFNILSFGEMINNSIETPPVAEAGSRTLAAAKASRFGLSIKVSEDGDISLFEDGSPIIKL